MQIARRCNVEHGRLNWGPKIVSFGKNGLWSTPHEARTDVSMVLGLVFLLWWGRILEPRRRLSFLRKLA